MQSVADTVAGGKSDARSAKDLAVDAIAELESRRSNPGRYAGFASGLTHYDKLLGGFRRGVVHVIAARPSMGKSALAVGIAKHADTGVLYVSNEMPAVDIMHRVLCSESGIPSDRYFGGRLRDTEWPRLAGVAEGISGKPIWVMDRGGRTLDKLTAAVMRMKAAHDVGLVVVDYLQLMRGGKRDSREREIADISNGIVELASEAQVAVILLSQLNRACESRDDKRPLLGDLRESGAIEQDAHTVTMIYRDAYYKPDTDRHNTAELLVRKNRNGKCGKVDVRWRYDTMSFVDIDQGRGQ